MHKCKHAWMVHSYIQGQVLTYSMSQTVTFCSNKVIHWVWSHCMLSIPYVQHKPGTWHWGWEYFLLEAFDCTDRFSKSFATFVFLDLIQYGLFDFKQQLDIGSGLKKMQLICVAYRRQSRKGLKDLSTTFKLGNWVQWSEKNKTKQLITSGRTKFRVPYLTPICSTL